MWEWLVGVGVVAIGVAWLKNFLNSFLPPPGRARLALANLLSSSPHPSVNRFRIVLCWLKDDNGADGETVARALTAVRGVELVRSARLVAARGAADDWVPAMQQSAFRVLEEWQADLAIVGLVKKSGESLGLWFVPRSGDSTLDRPDPTFRLEHVTLGADFHDELHAQLTALALAPVAPLAITEVRGRKLDQGLKNAAARLSNLLTGRKVGDSKRRAVLYAALGTALQSLGERERGTVYLEKAVEAHRASLEVLDRERAPLYWAATQVSLANALATLGKRESDTKLLQQAEEAYRAALEVCSRERAPLAWAEAQNNLGATLQVLGERESGTKLLQQAEEAYRAALEVRTRASLPLDWAVTQNNLGNALQILGERESGTARLEHAVKAHRSVLVVRTRERVPLQWATTQNSLGNALVTLAVRESGTARLEQAVEAYRAALEVRTRERAPLDWAATQNNLGNAAHTLGKRESGTARLEQAMEAYRAALEEVHTSACSAPVGHDAEQSWQCPCYPW